ncbi:hypothetical protein ACQHIV_22890 [Kribbella sp. GL6]|uniref:hypothetical protein n=1 Tax=Kribbella sp. GL6 TaxID=3419765 RepID=UPI003CFEC09E
MDYADFDSERRRIVKAWGTSITDPDELAGAAEALREQAATIQDGADRTRAVRHLRNLDNLVTAARTPVSETLRKAGEVLQEAARADGTPEEIRTRAVEGIAALGRIADSAPTLAERDAVLEMNEPLFETLDVLDATPDSGSGRPVDVRTAGFANDRAIAPPTRMPAPSGAATGRANTGSGPTSPDRGL